jgi:hypothetical protein
MMEKAESNVVAILPHKVLTTVILKIYIMHEIILRPQTCCAVNNGRIIPCQIFLMQSYFKMACNNFLDSRIHQR